MLRRTPGKHAGDNPEQHESAERDHQRDGVVDKKLPEALEGRIALSESQGFVVPPAAVENGADDPKAKQCACFSETADRTLRRRFT